MLKYFLPLVLVGCGATLPNRSDTIQLANQVATELLQVYKFQQEMCVEKSTTKDQAITCVTNVRGNWEPVWISFDMLQYSTDNQSWCRFLGELDTHAVPTPVVLISRGISYGSNCH